MLSEEQRAELYKWWSVFRRDRFLVEIRIIDGKKIWSGYYTNIENIIRDVERHMDANVYFTINLLDKATYGRPQHEQCLLSPKNTTTDAEISRRVFVFLDIDCKKIANVNSTDEEKALAYKKTGEIYKFLLNNGYNDMIVIDSGNSYHIYIPCDMDTSDESNKLVERFTHAIAMLFSDDKVDIDLKVSNLARIAKLPSTFSRKGSALSIERPQRPCKILYVPNEIVPTDSAYFRRIAELYPEEEKPSAENNYRVDRGSFDLDAWLAKYGINVTGKEKVAGGTKYYLEHCVFNPQHCGKDAVIYRADNGAITYFCYHNSCSHHKWKDVRLKFEPDYLPAKERIESYRRQQYYAPYAPQQFTPIPETEEKGKKWLNPSEIKFPDPNSVQTINTGFIDFDAKMNGLLLGEVTVVSGHSASGKSTWINSLISNVVNRNVKCAIWSGELQNHRLLNWLDLCLAGKPHVKKKEGYENWYYVPSAIAEKINLWLDGKLFIYSANYGNVFQQIFHDIKEVVEREKVSLVLIDNLSALNIETLDGKTNEKQTHFINQLKDYAKEKNIHIIVIIHPRKQNDLLRKESVSGSQNLTQLVDNVILTHRKNIDFEKRAADFFGNSFLDKYADCDLIVEIAKSREGGGENNMVGLYFEQGTRRIKNSIAEHIVYGWADEPKVQPIFNSFEPSYDNSPDDEWLATTEEECPF